jgi:uncharacterized Fe-S center protein
MSEVVWVDTQGMTADNSVSHKLSRLLVESGGLAGLEEGMSVALKIGIPEEGYEYGLRPQFLRTIAELVMSVTQSPPILCDGLKLVDYWRRSGGKVFLAGAHRQGYASDILAGQLAINGGFSGDEGNLYSCGRSDTIIGGAEVGTAICRSDALIVLSHVTLHPLFGLTGALLNGGFECLTAGERVRLLKGLNLYTFNGDLPPMAELAAFQRRALETLFCVRAAIENRVFYLNYLWDVTPQPEYFPYSATPIAENLGFLASPDPVALDAATWALLRESREGEPGQASCSRFVGEDTFARVLQEAESLGIGSASPRITRLS